MPRPKKDPRLWLQPERRGKDGKVRERAVYVILYDGRKHSTGCGKEEHDRAKIALAEYMIALHVKAEPEGDMPASKIQIADVLAYYAKEAGAGVARPQDLAGRIDRLLDFFGDHPLSYVRGATCTAFARHRGTQSGARRDLQDLRAAVNLYIEDGLCRDKVVVKLPPKEDSRVEYLTRDQVAALVWHCWRAREVQKGVVTDKHHLRHAIPYILTAVYTGSRSARISKASFEREEGKPWLDLDGGLFYRTPIRGTAAKNKKAGAVRIPRRLLAQMRRWRDGPMGKDGVRKPRKYLVEYRGRPADPKKSISNAMAAVFGEDHGYVRHTFRHTCATWLMWSGIDVGDIASYLSMTRETLVKVYGKEHPDADQSAGEAFSTGKAGRRKIGLGIRDERRTEPNETGGTKGHSRVREDA